MHTYALFTMCLFFLLSVFRVYVGECGRVAMLTTTRAYVEHSCLYESVQLLVLVNIIGRQAADTETAREYLYGFVLLHFFFFQEMIWPSLEHTHACNIDRKRIWKQHKIGYFTKVFGENKQI